jgi:aldose 1-epimerase
MADAFNRPECAATIRLEPGAERRFRCGVQVTTP